MWKGSLLFYTMSTGLRPFLQLQAQRMRGCLDLLPVSPFQIIDTHIKKIQDGQTEEEFLGWNVGTSTPA